MTRYCGVYNICIDKINKKQHETIDIIPKIMFKILMFQGYIIIIKIDATRIVIDGAI